MKEKNYTIGELANLLGTTVRTIQYYDKVNILPAKRDANNLRYYNERDLVKLQQILFYKKLGVSLKEIKENCLKYEHQSDLKLILKRQYEVLFKKSLVVKTNLTVIESVLATMDYGEPLDIEELMKFTLRINDTALLDHYAVPYDDKLEAIFEESYTDLTKVDEVYWKWKKLVLEAFLLKQNGINPQSKYGYHLGKKWAVFVNYATENNPDLVKAYEYTQEESGSWPVEDQYLLEYCNGFIDAAYHYYRKENAVDI